MSSSNLRLKLAFLELNDPTFRGLCRPPVDGGGPSRDPPGNIAQFQSDKASAKFHEPTIEAFRDPRPMIGSASGSGADGPRALS